MNDNIHKPLASEVFGQRALRPGLRVRLLGSGLYISPGRHLGGHPTQVAWCQMWL